MSATTRNALIEADAESDAGWHLDVVSGPNAGASVPLTAGQYRLGARSDNDIILAERTLADVQATITVSAGDLTIETAAPGLSAAGRQVAPGHAMGISAGGELAIGDTLMKFRGPSSPRRRRAHWFALGLVPVLLAAAASVALARHPRVPRNTAQAATAAAATPAPQDASTAARALQQRVQTARLQNAISVTAANGAVVVSGALTADQRPAWTATQMWFDQHYHGTQTLVDHIGQTAPADHPTLVIQAVSTGDVPYVIDAKGERYTEGAFLDGGWMIEHIFADKIVLSKDGREVSETL